MAPTGHLRAMNPQLGAGVSLKPEYYGEALDAERGGLWFEVHPENYFVAGGPRLAWLQAIRERHPLSLHGVSVSLAADAPPDALHLGRLVELTRYIEPTLVSEHLAWSCWRGNYFPDLLPFPRSNDALLRIEQNISAVQDALKRHIAIENPSHYVRIEGHDWSEIDFFNELTRRTGCKLLLDVNNVYVSARNLGYDAGTYLDNFPAEAIAEIHLAGHSKDPNLGARLLIDSHDEPVCTDVWALFARLMRRIGPRPTLLERDGNLPAFDALKGERDRAESIMLAPVAKAAC